MLRVKISSDKAKLTVAEFDETMQTIIVKVEKVMYTPPPPP